MKYKFIDKALWFPREKILVISDLHIGHEEAMNRAGIFLPRVQFKQIMQDLRKIFEIVGSVEEIIVLGDLKHEFGKISDQEWSETLKVLDFLLEKSKKVVLIKGNHDTVLGRIAEKKGIEIKNYYIRGEKVFAHGHKLFPEMMDRKIRTFILGHRHPAVIISDKYKKERYKCFLVGKWRGKNVVILPSFFPLIEGTDIVNTEENNLLFIPESKLKSFEVYVIGEKVYDFGKLRKLETQ
jgi:putative SbcD/Mre11-related phosphoesterase